jgi:hypothetical protein
MSSTGFAMPTFVLRVELHRAGSEDYDRLHGLMERSGFHRTIDVSEPCYLPTGEYRYESTTESVVVVAQKAERIAAAVRPNPAIVVSECANIAIAGLKPIAPLGLMAATAAGVARGITTTHGLIGNAFTPGAPAGLKK